MEIEAIKLLTYSRFDLVTRIMYVKSYIKNLDTTYFLNVYKEGMWAGGFYFVGDDGNKNNFKDFIDAFDSLIDSMVKSGFDRSISKIPFITMNYDSKLISKHIHIVNGAHRTSTSIVMGGNVYLRPVNRRRVNADTYDLLMKELPRKILDHMAIEYSKLKTNTFLMVTLHETVHDLNLINNICNKYGHLVYQNSTNLTKTGTLNLIEELNLSDELNLESFDNSGYFGIRKVYLIETDYIQELKEEIKEIKTTFITTKHKITVDASKLVFNENSVDRLNNNISNNTNEIDIILDKFKEDIEKTNGDLDDYCIVGSLPKFLLGQSKEFKMEFVSLKTGYDDMIYNPKNHFYYRGIKFSI